MSFFTILLFFIVLVLIRIYSLDHCLDDLSYDIEPEKKLVECDESFRLRSSFTNRKALPVFFLQVYELIPRELALREEDKALFINDRGYTPHLEESLYLLPHQKATRKLQVSLPRRGRYLFRGATYTSGDLFGFEEKMKNIDLLKEVIVIPRRADLSKIEHSFGDYLGDISVRRFIMPDPIDTIGFREYSGREPMRDISWPQSLRRNRLMVKTYDYTSEKKATLLLDITGGDAEEIEKAYSIARSAAEELEKKGIRFRFYTNASIITPKGERGHIPDGIGHRHLETVYDALGRASHEKSKDFRKILEEALRDKDDGRSYILISTDPDSRNPLLDDMERRTGKPVFKIDVRSMKEDLWPS